MKCVRATELMQEYADGLLNPVVRADLEDHVADCSACRAELSVLMRLCRSISSLPRIEPGFDMVGTVRERIAGLPNESFAWPIVPQRERPRLWILAALLWIGMVAAAVSTYHAQLSAITSGIADGLAGAGHWVWSQISGVAAEVFSALGPVGRAGCSAANDVFESASEAHILAYVAGFLLACFLVVVADRLKKLRAAAGTLQTLS